MDFQLVTSYKPRGDQPRAIDELVQGLAAGEQHQVLLGVTGSGKTFTMAKVIEQCNRPALILAHNKTLAAQLYHEFKQFFPSNAVEYFVSYYDYYQPEAYIPAGDLYIEKEATINEELDKLRLSATRSLFERRDAIIVSSVSLHLRPRLAGGLLRHAAAARKRPEDQPQRHHSPPRRNPLRAQRLRLPPRHLPRARRRDRSLPHLRRNRPIASSSSATRSNRSRRSIRSSAPSSRSTRACPSIPRAITWSSRSARPRPSTPSSPS